MRAITIIPLGRIDLSIAEFLALVLSDLFQVPCEIRTQRLALTGAYDAERRQYLSTKLLQELLLKVPDHGDHLLGLIDLDLFIPILTFVFGEAQLGGRGALVSVHRLRERLYGPAADERLFLERCEKEAIHELGHTLGLKHCPVFECVMHYANTAEDIDIKRNVFCPNCSRLLDLPSRW